MTNPSGELPFFPPSVGFNMTENDDQETLDEKTRKFIQASRSQETVRKTDHWIRRLQDHSKKLNGDKPLTSLNKAEINSLLCSFLMDVKKNDGDNYETNTIHCMFSVINRFIKDNKLGDLEEDQEYQGARDVKKAKLKKLKSEGKGNRPMRAEALTKAQEELLYAKGQFGRDSPHALQRTLWWQTSLFFGHRARDESRKMTWGDIKLDKDENGRQYLEFSERSTKTRDGSMSGGSREFTPKAFECPENPDRCPVRTYKEFARRRPLETLDADSPFYLAINHKRRPDDPIWYSRAPLGKNTLGSMVKTACEEAGITGRKTNHSTRKTCVKRALSAGCPREYVKQLTGHKSVQSLENYAEADEDEQRAMFTSVLTGARYNVAGNVGVSTATVSTASSGPAITFNFTNCTNVTVNK